MTAVQGAAGPPTPRQDDIHVRTTVFVDGMWTPARSNDLFNVVCASTEEVMGCVPAATAADVDGAVAAARHAFPAWSTATIDVRLGFIERLGTALRTRRRELAETITGEVGTPHMLSQLVQVGMPIMTCTTMPTVVEEVCLEEEIGNSMVLREPIGVVACITPWNYPLHQVVAKVAPALAAGCTVVVKPSEVAPLAVFMLADILDAIELPSGVFNLVSGSGATVGEALVEHPDVDMVSFTGSTRAGRRVAAVAASTVKRVALELGGKSPSVILDDADLPRAVADTVAKAFLNSGQTCSALTRMIVPRARQEEVEALACEAVATHPLVDPFGPKAGLGPLVTATQRDRVQAHIRRGLEEGARLVAGGDEPPEGFDRGYYVRPTVFADVTPEMRIAQEEVFGPVLCILAYDTEQEAVRIANDTIYGLAAAVWSASEDRGKRVARQVRAGQVEVNGGRYNPLAPFGGYKQSGNGRELGRFGFEEYTELKALHL